MKWWHVVYRVKYSEQWCADECCWVEDDATVQAKSEHEARRLARNNLRNRYRFLIIGRHVSTSLSRRNG